MFKNAKVGDRAYSAVKGWGTIVAINLDSDYPIRFVADIDDLRTFTLEGKTCDTDVNPTLFWDEIKYEIPKKPLDLESELRKLEVVEFKKDGKNFFLLWENEYGNIEYDFFYQQEFPLMKYFNKESIDNFMNNIKDRKITKEEFFKAYNVVFGGK